MSLFVNEPATMAYFCPLAAGPSLGAGSCTGTAGAAGAVLAARGGGGSVSAGVGVSIASGFEDDFERAFDGFTVRDGFTVSGAVVLGSTCASSESGGTFGLPAGCALLPALNPSCL